MLFEWDEIKREINLRKYGLDLIRAADLFDGRQVLTRPSSRGDELRFSVWSPEGRFCGCRMDCARCGHPAYFCETSERCRKKSES